MAAKIVKRRNSDPLEAIEARYGSLEEFAVAVIDNVPEVLEQGANLSEAAVDLGVPFTALTRAMSHPDFHKMLDRLASFGEYSFAKRRVAMGNLATIATTMQKTTMSRSGQPVLVDREADEIIKADSHLRKVQGQPVDEKKQSVDLGIQIVFGGASEGESIDVEVRDGDEEEGPEAYRGNRRGALPPEGARRFYRDEQEPRDPDKRLRPEFDFDREETEGPKGTGSVAAAATLGKRNEDDE